MDDQIPDACQELHPHEHTIMIAIVEEIDGLFDTHARIQGTRIACPSPPPGTYVAHLDRIKFAGVDHTNPCVTLLDPTDGVCKCKVHALWIHDEQEGKVRIYDAGEQLS